MADCKEQEIEISPDDINQRLSMLERFIARRFDEISMEINATSQLIDMTEEALGKKFSEILQVLNAVSTYRHGITSSNSGHELDAVVKETERATNDIMDAADRIDLCLKENHKWDDTATRNSLLGAIKKDIETIMLSCSFQDMTGQRINKAVSNIRDAEKRLHGILEDLGIHVSDVESLSSELRKSIASQSDVDALFADARRKQSS